MGYVLKAVLSSAQHPEYGQITVPFPIPDEKYDRMIELLEPLEIGDALRQDCRVDELDSFYTVLNRLVGSLVNFDELDYMYLKDRADSEGRCWPAIRTIALELGLSRSTVKRALDDLCRAGLLQKDPRWRENGSLTSNLYHVV